MKKFLTFLMALFGVVFMPLTISACGGQQDSQQQEEPTNSKIQFSSTVDQVAVGDTITLRVLVTGTAKRDVSWSSGDSSIATVSSNGTVTGIKKGKVGITAALKSEPNVKATLDVTVFEAVVPTSIAINGEEEQIGWVDEDIELELSFEPSQSDKRCNFISNNPTVATVSNEGVISFLKIGTVEITASAIGNSEIKDTVSFTVKNGPFWTNRKGYSTELDYSHQADEINPYVQTTYEVKDGADAMVPAIAWFKTQPATRFYAEAEVGFIQSTSDPWTRIGIGTATNDMNSRVFYYCDKEGRKTTVLDFPVGFGGNQNQSTVWQVNGLGSINKRAFVLGVLRDGNNYYYTINGKLYWVEINKRFNELPAYPIIMGVTCSFTIKNAFVTLDNDYINAKLQLETYHDKFYSGSTVENVTYDKTTDSWTFKNMYRDGGDTVYISQQCAKPYGDAGLAENDFEIEYDISNLNIMADDEYSYAGLVLRRYDTWTDNFGSDMETFVFNQQHAFYRVWGSDKRFHFSTKQDYLSNNFETPIDNASHHVKLSRKVGEALSTFKMTIDDVPVVWQQNDKEVTELEVSFVGKYLVHFGTNDAEAVISNFKITNK